MEHPSALLRRPLLVMQRVEKKYEYFSVYFVFDSRRRLCMDR
jgi:hypothetical protein